jgi:glycosyltransferase involved in cell wall biosynthesis
MYRDRDFRLQCRHSTRIILSSYDAQHALSEFEPSCVAKSRVLQFVAQPRISDRTSDLRTLQARYGFDEPYFHVPNQFWAHKNHRLILDALAILRRRGRRVLVISTGATADYRQPDHFDKLMGYANSVGIRDDFRTLGVVPYDDAVALMINSIALINPSRSEGWSTSVEEAKSLGKRIILSDLPVHREQAPPDGIYVDPDDATGLADALEFARASFDVVAEKERAGRAAAELPLRIRTFAQTYQQIVMEAAAEKAPGGRRDGPRIS